MGLPAGGLFPLWITRKQSAEEAPRPGITFKGPLVPTSPSEALLNVLWSLWFPHYLGTKRSEQEPWGGLEDLSHKPGTVLSTDKGSLFNAW